MSEFALKNNIYLNNNDILLKLIEQLENIIKDINNNIIIKRIKDIIMIMNKLINDNKKYYESIKKMI